MLEGLTVLHAGHTVLEVIQQPPPIFERQVVHVGDRKGRYSFRATIYEFVWIADPILTREPSKLFIELESPHVFPPLRVRRTLVARVDARMGHQTGDDNYRQQRAGGENKCENHGYLLLYYSIDII